MVSSVKVSGCVCYKHSLFFIRSIRRLLAAFLCFIILSWTFYYIFGFLQDCTRSKFQELTFKRIIFKKKTSRYKDKERKNEATNKKTQNTKNKKEENKERIEGTKEGRRELAEMHKELHYMLHPSRMSGCPSPGMVVRHHIAYCRRFGLIIHLPVV